MYLHLGQDVAVSTKSVVGIFDMESTTVNKDTRRFLYDKEHSGRVVNVVADLPRTFVLTQDSAGDKVYISQISSATLLKRAQTCDLSGE